MDNQAPDMRAAGRGGGAASITRRGFLTTAIAATVAPLPPTPQRLNVIAEMLGALLADGVGAAPTHGPMCMCRLTTTMTAAMPTTAARRPSMALDTEASPGAAEKERERCTHRAIIHERLHPYRRLLKPASAKTCWERDLFFPRVRQPEG